jgi:hypothetical protein
MEIPFPDASSFSFRRFKRPLRFCCASAHGENILRAIIQRLKVPATESQLSIALALSVFVMSLLLWGILWQSSIINQQREAIRWLSSLKGGHIG